MLNVRKLTPKAAESLKIYALSLCHRISTKTQLKRIFYAYLTITNSSKLKSRFKLKTYQNTKRLTTNQWDLANLLLTHNRFETRTLPIGLFSVSTSLS